MSNKGKRMESTSKTRAELNISQLGGLRGEEYLLALGLSSIWTMVTAFVRVVEYRTYRLRNQQWQLSRRESMDMKHLKQQLDGLHPTLYPFDEAKPVRFLSFLSIMRDAFYTFGASEVAAVRVLAYFLGGDARDAHREQFFWFSPITQGNLRIAQTMAAGRTSSMRFSGGSSAMTCSVNLTMESLGQVGQTGRMKRSKLRGSRGRLAYGYMSLPKTTSSPSMCRG